MKQFKRDTVVLFCRDSVEAKYISTELFRHHLLDILVIEKGIQAKKAKLKRFFKKSEWYLIPIRILDILSVSVLNFLVNYYLNRTFKDYVYPQVNTYYINDINEEISLNVLKKLNNPIVIILGTSIIKQPFLSVRTKATLNIHMGIVPYYKNVHSEFWALFNKDFNRIGTTIMHIDGGIDSGDIVIQKTISYAKGDNLLTIKVKNINLSSRLIIQAVKDILKDRHVKTKQDINIAKSYPTPSFMDLIKYYFRNFK